MRLRSIAFPYSQSFLKLLFDLARQVSSEGTYRHWAAHASPAMRGLDFHEMCDLSCKPPNTNFENLQYPISASEGARKTSADILYLRSAVLL